MSHTSTWHIGVASCVLALLAAAPAAAQSAQRTLIELSLDELSEIEVTSVSLRAQSIAEAPASIFVITAEDIRRAGVVRLAEALRLAPNLEVARLDAGQYAISARGFNGVGANKLLVLVDGRLIYTPLFSGVFWDQQDVLLEDVERIEVISGPGATLWGVNAVNGVINVITRSARDTHGTLVSVGGGNRERTAVGRYGTALGANGHMRLYGKTSQVETSTRADGSSITDGRVWYQGGFRADWGDVRDGTMLQGDVHLVRSEDRGTVAGFVLGRAELSGASLHGAWTRQLGAGSELRVKGSYDRIERDEAVLFQPKADMVSGDVQHAFAVGRHRVVWGTGYRWAQDEVEDGIFVGFRPTGRSLNWSNVFAQDDVRLDERLEASVGIRFSRNTYTGWEAQPDFRLSWSVRPQHFVWGGVSRAVRAPSRLDREVIFPLGGNVFGGPNFAAEVANVVQVGYRAQAAGAVTWSATAFLHDWDRVRSGTAVPVILENRIEGPVYGVEGWATWQVRPRWRLTAGGVALRKELRLEAGSTDPVGVNNPSLGSDPGHQVTLRSSITLRAAHDLDTSIRHVGELPITRVPAYTAVDVRYAWRAYPGLELSLIGQNLFDARHAEHGDSTRAEFDRAFVAQITWWR